MMVYNLSVHHTDDPNFITGRLLEHADSALKADNIYFHLLVRASCPSCHDEVLLKTSNVASTTTKKKTKNVGYDAAAAKDVRAFRPGLRESFEKGRGAGRQDDESAKGGGILVEL
jgi:hypothetical protein